MLKYAHASYFNNYIKTLNLFMTLNIQLLFCVPIDPDECVRD